LFVIHLSYVSVICICYCCSQILAAFFLNYNVISFSEQNLAKTYTKQNAGLVRIHEAENSAENCDCDESPACLCVMSAADICYKLCPFYSETRYSFV